jgi:hypothetical protein
MVVGVEAEEAEEAEALAVFTAVLPINTMDNTVMTARHSIF